MPGAEEPCQAATSCRGTYGAEPKTFIDFDWRLDRHGFRNPEDYERADVVLLGDSFVEGAQLSNGELATARMAQTLGALVVNLGQSNYGPQQELVALKRHGLPLQPRTCVWFFFEGNDFHDLWRYRELTGAWDDVVAKRSSRIERSFAKNVLLAFGRQQQPPLDGLLRSAVFRNRPQRPRFWFAYPGEELTASDLEALQLTSDILAQAHDSCRRQGAYFAVVFVPIKFRVYADLLDLEPGSLLNNWTVNDLPGRVREEVGELGEDVVFIDLTPGFQAETASGKLLFFPDDTHWTAAGHALAAELISREMRSVQLAEPTAR